MINSKDGKNSFLLLLIPMLIVSVILQIVHLPEIVSINRPDFALLVILFFSIHTNFSAKLEAAFITGIILDLVSGAPLGINALIMSSQIYLISVQFKNFPKYMLWQQMIIVGLINFLASTISYWIVHIIGVSNYDLNVLIPAVVTAVFWPVIYFISMLLCATFSVSLSSEKEAMN